MSAKESTILEVKFSSWSILDESSFNQLSEYIRAALKKYRGNSFKVVFQYNPEGEEEAIISYTAPMATQIIEQVLAKLHGEVIDEITLSGPIKWYNPAKDPSEFFRNFISLISDINLKSLSLEGYYLVNQNNLMYLENLPARYSLERLNLENFQVLDTQILLDILPNFQKLQYLNLSATDEWLRAPIFTTNIKDLSTLSSSCRESNLKLRINYYEIHLEDNAKGKALTQDFLDISSELRTSVIKKLEFNYIPILSNFLEELLDSKISLFFNVSSEWAHVLYHANLRKQFEGVIKQTAEPNKSLLSVIDFGLFIPRNFGSILKLSQMKLKFKSELAKVFLEREGYNNYMYDVLQLLESENYYVESSSQSVGNALIYSDLGETALLRARDIIFLKNFACVLGTENVQEIANSILIQSFWYRNAIFKGDDLGAYFGDGAQLIPRDLLDNIASFLPQDRLNEELTSLFFTEDQVNSIATSILKTHNSFIDYIEAIDGRVIDAESDYHIANVIARYITEDRRNDIYVAPILINPREDALQRCDQTLGNHWVLYVHHGMGQGYIINPTSGDTLYSAAIFNIINGIQALYPVNEAGQPVHDIRVINTGLQDDGFNCGPWVLHFIERINEELTIRRLMGGVEENGHDFVLDTIEDIVQEYPDIRQIRQRYEQQDLAVEYLEEVYEEPMSIESLTVHTNSTQGYEDITPSLDTDKVYNLGGLLETSFFQ